MPLKPGKNTWSWWGCLTICSKLHAKLDLARRYTASCAERPVSPHHAAARWRGEPVAARRAWEHSRTTGMRGYTGKATAQARRPSPAGTRQYLSREVASDRSAGVADRSGLKATGRLRRAHDRRRRAATLAPICRGWSRYAFSSWAHQRAAIGLDRWAGQNRAGQNRAPFAVLDQSRRWSHSWCRDEFVKTFR